LGFSIYLHEDKKNTIDGPHIPPPTRSLCKNLSQRPCKAGYLCKNLFNNPAKNCRLCENFDSLRNLPQQSAKPLFLQKISTACKNGCLCENFDSLQKLSFVQKFRQPLLGAFDYREAKKIKVEFMRSQIFLVIHLLRTENHTLAS